MMMKTHSPKAGIIIMGVSGCGKTAVGKALAQKIAAPFLDADEYHSPQNIEKMKAGIPLDDDDRWHWLDATARAFADLVKVEPNGVLACSALKRTYRDRIEDSMGEKPNWVFLDGSRDLLMSRLAARKDHFFNSELLDSQLQTLEKPKRAYLVTIDQTIEQIVRKIEQEI